MNTLILASTSPRRRELLAHLGIPFIVRPSRVDESALNLSGPPPQQVMDSASAKAAAVAGGNRDSWILAADTVVCVDDLILGKPYDEADARRMLALLSGRSHTVITGLCLYHDRLACPPPVYEETRVWMTPLAAEQIEDYLASGESMDKAGAYGIQGFGGSLIPRIEGCYFNVMGLPLYRTARLLEEAGFTPAATEAGNE